MRVAISAESNNDLDSQVSAHFGRCPYFVLVDLDGGAPKNVTTVANPFFGNHAPGQVPEFIRSQSVDVMVSGGMGAGAISFFHRFGISVATGASGSVEQAVEAYLRNELSGDPCHPDHQSHGHDCQDSAKG